MRLEGDIGDDASASASWPSGEGFGARIKEVIAQLGMEASVTASGRNSRSLARYMSGAEPPLSVVTNLAGAAGVSITWLATGNGPRDSSEETSHVLKREQEHGRSGMLQVVDRAELEAGSFVLIPRFDVQASAGHGIVASEEDLKDFIAVDPAYLRSAGIDPRQAHMIQVRGRSMVPTLTNGEWVIIDMSETTGHENEIYAVVYNDAVLVKRVRRQGGAYILVSDNKDGGVPDTRIEGDDLQAFKIVGRVRRHIRSL